LQQTRGTTLILGLGNPLSGDDSFGPKVIEHLRQSKTDPPQGATLIDAHTDLLNHIEDFMKYDCVLLIDAVLDPEGKLGRPGKIAVLHEHSFRSFPETSQSIHQMSPLLAVKLFRTLHPESPIQITLIGIIIDRLTAEPRYVTPDRIVEASELIRKTVKERRSFHTPCGAPGDA
jgi:hydrogenase maturation protease